jgi:hypothetical protein
VSDDAVGPVVLLVPDDVDLDELMSEAGKHTSVVAWKVDRETFDKIQELLNGGDGAR